MVTELPDRKNRKNGGLLTAAQAISQRPMSVLLPEPLLEFSQGSEARPTVVFRSEHLGEGNPVLGDQLMKELFQALLAYPEAPQALLFYNTAVYLVLDDSLVLDAMRQLAARGCEILACKTSLQILAPGRTPAAGRAAPLAELTDRMRQARQLLWP